MFCHSSITYCYSFLINKIFGFITLAAYFLNLFAAWYSYNKVGLG
jgi:hypothetical protein